jgi:kumamolisin
LNRSILSAFAFGAGTFALLTAAAPATVLSPTVVADVPHVALSDLGLAPANGRISIALTLNYRNRALLDQITELQIDETSPLFEHWLTPQQFNDSFAPTPAQYAQVARTLQRAGFTITNSYANRTVIDATGTVGAAERLFDTEIHQVMQPGVGRRYANVRPAVVPAELGSLVLNVDGLHDLQLVHTHIATVRPHGGGGVNPQAAGAPLYGPTSSETGLAGFGPLAFSQGYDLPEQHAVGAGYYDGTGRASGVVIDADFLDSDLSTFLSYFNVTRDGPATSRVLVDGGPPSGDQDGDSIETTLDVETIVSNAPGTALYVYEMPALSNQDITDSYNKVVSDNLVDTANSSFGGSELAIGKTTVEAWDSIAEQGGALGITFHASSGDSGSDGGAVEAPASSPHFVAIGGTDLSVDSNGNYTGETGWSGSGGGVSHVFPVPKYQKSITGVLKTGRNVPDLAFDADPYTGAAYYYGGSWNTAYNPLGGTSLASPIFGASLTETDEVLGARTGLAAVDIFAFFKKNGYGTTTTYFHDITSGSNGEYRAGTGYDRVTGIGSTDAFNLVAAFEKKKKK